jgi:hypothetical protein
VDVNEAGSHHLLEEKTTLTPSVLGYSDPILLSQIFPNDF